MSIAIARAKELNTLGLSKWVFGPYVEFDGKGYILVGKPHLSVNNILSNTYCIDGFVQVDPTTVCYGTGRKDKTGKDIYKGERENPRCSHRGMKANLLLIFSQNFAYTMT